MKAKVKVVVDRQRLFTAMEKAVEKKLDYAALSDCFADATVRQLRRQLELVGEATGDSLMETLIPEKD